MFKDKKLLAYGVVSLLGLGLIIFLAVKVVPTALVTMTKAAPSNKISIENSYVLGAKILAKADGKDKCVVNVFVMDNGSKGVPDKRVELLGMETIKPLAIKTDKDGRIGFEMTSDRAGQFRLRAMVEGIEMPKEVRVTFR